MYRDFCSASYLNDITFISFASIILFASSTSAQCYGFWVSNADTQQSVNGYYTQVGEGRSAYRCSGYNVWVQEKSGNDDQQINYIFYVANSSTSNTSYLYANSWVIAPINCKLPPYVNAKNTYINGTFPKYPYQMSNTWLEYGVNTSSYVTNYDLTITCTGNYSVSTIIVTVFLCLIALILIISVMITAVRKYKKIKRRRAQTDASSEDNLQTAEVYRQTVSTSADNDFELPHYTPDTEELPATDTYTGPPKYDNNPPPSYEELVFST